jgi:hypothetical protein
MTPPDHKPPDVAGDSRRPDDPGGSIDRRHAIVSGRSSHDDDLFYFVDKAAGVALLCGVGYLLLQYAPGAFWIAVGLTVSGGTIKLLFRVL